MNLANTFTIRKSISENGSFTIQEVFNVLNNSISGYSLFNKNSREELDVVFPTEDEAFTYSNELLAEKEIV